MRRWSGGRTGGARVAAAATLGGLLLSIAVVGCTTSQSCVDWVRYDSTDAMAKESGLVLTGTVSGEVGSTTVYGARAPIHRVTVGRVLKGTHSGRTIDVVSTPETCGDTVGDQLKVPAGRTYELFLFRDGDRWRTITPFQGVVRVGNKGLPFHPVETPVPEVTVTPFSTSTPGDQ